MTVLPAPTNDGNTTRPSIAIVDRSEFRRTCVSANFVSRGFGKVAHFSKASLIQGRIRFDLIVFFFDSDQPILEDFEEDARWVRKFFPQSKLIAVVDELAEFSRGLPRGIDEVRAVLAGNMKPELMSAAFCLVHLGYALVPAVTAQPALETPAPPSDRVNNYVVLDGHPLLARSTPRQRQVLEALLLGESNKQISERLAISESTVKSHVYFLMRILGASSRTQIVLKLAFHDAPLPLPSSERSGE